MFTSQRQIDRLRVGLALQLTATLVVACATGHAPTSTPVSTPTPNAASRELINPNDMLADASRYGDLVFTAGFLGMPPATTSRPMWRTRSTASRRH